MAVYDRFFTFLFLQCSSKLNFNVQLYYRNILCDYVNTDWLFDFNEKNHSVLFLIFLIFLLSWQQRWHDDNTYEWITWGKRRPWWKEASGFRLLAQQSQAQLSWIQLSCLRTRPHMHALEFYLQFLAHHSYVPWARPPGTIKNVSGTCWLSRAQLSSTHIF